MPNPKSWLDSPSLFTQGNNFPYFNEPVAAEVPPVQLTHRDWRDIQTVIASLGTLSKNVHGDLAHSIIGRSSIADEAKLAEDLMVRFGIKEEDL